MVAGAHSPPPPPPPPPTPPWGMAPSLAVPYDHHQVLEMNASFLTSRKSSHNRFCLIMCGIYYNGRTL